MILVIYGQEHSGGTRDGERDTYLGKPPFDDECTLQEKQYISKVEAGVLLQSYPIEHLVINPALGPR